MAGHAKPFEVPQLRFERLRSVTLVSVIIPTRNRLDLLQRALQSVDTQSYPDKEVLIVDDASTDGTADWLAKAPYRCFFREIQGGAASARNLALQQTRGEVIAFLDDDDLWDKDYLERQVKSLQHCDLSFTAHHDSISTVDDQLLFDYEDPVVGYLCESYLHSMSVVACRRALVDQVGLLDPRWRITHDYDWYARMLLAGARVSRVPEVSVVRRRQVESLVTNHRLWFQEEDDILSELMQEYPHLRSSRGRIVAHRAVFSSWLALRRGDIGFARVRLQRALASSCQWTARTLCARVVRNLENCFRGIMES